eukprot:732623-Pyramimonas_sp.AAC.2
MFSAVVQMEGGARVAVRERVLHTQAQERGPADRQRGPQAQGDWLASPARIARKSETPETCGCHVFAAPPGGGGGRFIS